MCVCVCLYAYEKRCIHHRWWDWPTVHTQYTINIESIKGRILMAHTVIHSPFRFHTHQHSVQMNSSAYILSTYVLGKGTIANDKIRTHLFTSQKRFIYIKNWYKGRFVYYPDNGCSEYHLFPSKLNHENIGKEI